MRCLETPQIKRIKEKRKKIDQGGIEEQKMSGSVSNHTLCSIICHYILYLSIQSLAVRILNLRCFVQNLKKKIKRKTFFFFFFVVLKLSDILWQTVHTCTLTEKVSKLVYTCKEKQPVSTQCSVCTLAALIRHSCMNIMTAPVDTLRSDLHVVLLYGERALYSTTLSAHKTDYNEPYQSSTADSGTFLKIHYCQ